MDKNNILNKEKINYCLSNDFIFDINNKYSIEEIFSRLEELGFTIKYEDNDKHYYIINSFTMTVEPIEDNYYFLKANGVIDNEIFVRLLRYIFYIGDIIDVLNEVTIESESFTVQGEVGERLKKMCIPFKTIGVTSNFLCYKDKNEIEAKFARPKDYEVGLKINTVHFFNIYEIWKIKRTILKEV